ncbi:hypothetical protein A3C23_04515 [Candidatus Roizmanbacteria bacterium RIFCSPHIGHO2_02_FULL_37_13b]|uniref:Uncharacterized protein n=1 Tax=Candidatus Roizmanbacteria bacterium RIFCSPLOWO2_02_FULL_36_11 TaxID=1802071 RepID=A0A1F7JH89_9BACT|nr:MAG: hypothetical protein A3C23_04515 [Candidatus Roizmanbacteria bacterium RIFCSPHIGHO2_02_FULL_37_13b]OGK54971.1 MAG: hypothetical protein A3H78_00660 [Candidatus Roizmanbacteria bacterium RIFCSPLOWO2_02_FULL_36_11]
MVVVRAQTNNRLKVTMLLTVAILLTGILAGFLFISLNNMNEPQTTTDKAAEPESMCPSDGASCTWQYGDKGDVTFEYTITDQTTGKTVKTGQTADNKVTFTPQVNHKYSCKVVVVNECGEGPAKEATNTCSGQIQPTATPEPTTPQPTPTKILPSVTPGPTSTPVPTLKPNEPSKTPTPTEVSIVVTSQPATTVVVAQKTITPTPPPSGNLLPSLILIIAAVTIVGLGLVL